jgi:hypothetical protein
MTNQFISIGELALPSTEAVVAVAVLMAIKGRLRTPKTQSIL